MAKMKISKGIKSVSGLSVSDIMKMDVYKLNFKSLKAVTNRLKSASNKRLKRLYDKYPSAPALRPHLDANKDLVLFSSKGLKTYGEYENLISQIRSFMSAETSTAKGFKEFREDIETRIGEFESVEQENDFWHIYNEWIETHPNLTARFNNTNELVSMVYNEFIVKKRTAKGTKNKITRTIKKMLNDINEYQTQSDRAKRNELKNVNAFRTKKDI